MRLVYRPFPLISIHDKAQITTEAAEAAGAQGKFWEMHDVIFAKQEEWTKKLPAEMVGVLVDYAKEVGVPDLKKFQSDLEQGTYKEQVTAAYQSARDAGLSGTPALVINQVDYPMDALGSEAEGIKLFISLIELRESHWYAKPDQVIDVSKKYEATVETAKGNIVMELYADTAPVNVNSFAFLAEKGWYKGVTFHRVLPDFMAQGGDPTGSGVGFPGYRCKDEVVAAHTFAKAGMVALANSGPNTNGGQFFITYTATETLNPNFTIIGRVIEGQEVVDSLTPRNPEQGKDLPVGDEIVNITVKEKN